MLLTSDDEVLNSVFFTSSVFFVGNPDSVGLFRERAITSGIAGGSFYKSVVVCDGLHEVRMLMFGIWQEKARSSRMLPSQDHRQCCLLWRLCWRSAKLLGSMRAHSLHNSCLVFARLILGWLWLTRG